MLRGDAGRGWIARRAVAPMAKADNPGHVDSPVIADDKSVKLVIILCERGDASAFWRKIRRCDRSGPGIARRAIAPVAEAHNPGDVNRPVIPDNKGVELISALFCSCNRRARWG